MDSKRVSAIADPPLARALFTDTRYAWIWLIVRALRRLAMVHRRARQNANPAWVGAKAGTFLTVWVNHALTKTQGAHADVQGWYGAFLAHVVLPHAALFSTLVAFGETAVGLGLILGFFTGIAAFFGTVMNGSYLLAGTVSINPILFAFASLLVLAWKTAGWYGADRYLLMRLGTPWQPGPIEIAPQMQPQPVPVRPTA